MTVILVYVGGMLLFGISSGKMTRDDMLGLGIWSVILLIPILLFFTCYKILEKYRDKNPPKDTVQKLNLKD